MPVTRDAFACKRSGDAPGADADFEQPWLGCNFEHQSRDATGDRSLDVARQPARLVVDIGHPVEGFELRAISHDL